MWHKINPKSYSEFHHSSSRSSLTLNKSSTSWDLAFLSFMVELAGFTPLPSQFWGWLISLHCSRGNSVSTRRYSFWTKVSSVELFMVSESSSGLFSDEELDINFAHFDELEIFIPWLLIEPDSLVEEDTSLVALAKCTLHSYWWFACKGSNLVGDCTSAHSLFNIAPSRSNVWPE